MVDKAYEKMSVEEVMRHFGTGPEGLGPEAVRKSADMHGVNRLTEVRGPSAFLVFLSQFKDLLVIILLTAAGISAAIGKWESTLVILLVLVLNALLGTIQHIKAEQSLKSLKAHSSPLARVIRQGQKVEIPSEEVVVGDLLVLEAGDFVAADGRLVECFSLQTNESALTGESVSAEKDMAILESDVTSLGDRINCVFSSSHVTYGRGLAVVTAVGQKTEIGKIAQLITTAKEKATPLQQNLDAFGKKLAIGVVLISTVLFAMSLIRQHPLLDALMFAISLAVAAIPEALSSIVTIVLAIGTRKLAMEKAIIRKLHAVESLGGISVICSDKTGTLTQNKMVVQHLYADHSLSSSDVLRARGQEPLLRKLVLAGLLCNDAQTIENKKLGDPTEIALVDMGELAGLDELDVRRDIPRLSELPFDSQRKMMSTKHLLDGAPVMFTKGALDVILKRSTFIETVDGVRRLTQEDEARFGQVNHALSDQGLRVLAFAWKPHDGATLALGDEEGLTMLGIVSMMDPPREDSAEAVAACRTAGIKPVMITGDHKVTASAIARQIGILEPGDLVLDGEAVERMDEAALKEAVPKVSVYARVSPEHKIRIVSAWQDRGNVVAMTGDGVNDAPALKKADVGIAMGITGTEVSKDASCMVLMDDRFSTIVKAVRNGRGIYENIKNAIRFLLSGNTAGILAVLYASVMDLATPFAPVNLLFINLLTDSLPAIAIGLEPAHGNLMAQKPRDVGQPIITKRFAVEILIQGAIIAIVTMVAYSLGMQAGGHGVAMTMAFATLSLSRLVHGLNCRMEGPLKPANLFANPYSYLALLGGAVLLFGVLLLTPLHGVLEVSPLTGAQFGTIIGLSLIPLVLVQLEKWILKR
mgnify:CR=1 FL=1